MRLAFPIRAQVFVSAPEAIRFLGLDGQRLVVCAVTSRALEWAEAIPAGAAPPALLRVYERYASYLQSVAAWKYEAGQFDAHGHVTIDLVDLQRSVPMERDAAEPWPAVA